jgi:NAD(P)H-hydrate epimerase
MAQGYNPVESALLGVFIHGLAGDLYTNTHDPRSLVASDLPLHFSDAFQQLNLSDETDSEYSF